MKSRALMLQTTYSSTNKQYEQVTTNELDGHVKSIMIDLEGPRYLAVTWNLMLKMGY